MSTDRPMATVVNLNATERMAARTVSRDEAPMVSNCCGVEGNEDYLRCTKCKEHCEYIREGEE